MTKYPVRYGKKAEDVYYIDIFDDEIREIFDDLTKYGYSFIKDSKISRVIGMKFRPFKLSGIFNIGWNKYQYNTILALNQNYSIKKDEKNGNRYILFRF